MVAVDPVHLNTTIEQWRRHFVQWLRALDVTKQDGGLGRGRQGGETSLDVPPVLVDIANENETHAVPICPGRAH
jgi:hypothetical protein